MPNNIIQQNPAKSKKIVAYSTTLSTFYRQNYPQSNNLFSRCEPGGNNISLWPGSETPRATLGERSERARARNTMGQTLKQAPRAALGERKRVAVGVNALGRATQWGRHLRGISAKLVFCEKRKRSRNMSGAISAKYLVLRCSATQTKASRRASHRRWASESASI